MDPLLQPPSVPTSKSAPSPVTYNPDGSVRAGALVPCVRKEDGYDCYDSDDRDDSNISGESERITRGRKKTVYSREREREGWYKRGKKTER
jgi:hypothetical protein